MIPWNRPTLDNDTVYVVEYNLVLSGVKAGFNKAYMHHKAMMMS